jgi:hypothetical protein
MTEPIQDACRYTAGPGQGTLSLTMVGTFVLVGVYLYASHDLPGAEQPDKGAVAADPADKYPGPPRPGQRRRSPRGCRGRACWPT